MKCYVPGCTLELKYIGRSPVLSCALHGTRGANPAAAGPPEPPPRTDRPIPDPVYDLEEDANTWRS